MDEGKKTINAKAAEAVALLPSVAVTLDPLLLVAIASLIIQAIVALINCNKNKEQVSATFYSPSVFEQMRLRKLIKDSGIKFDHNQVRSALLKVGQYTSLQETESMIEEVKHNG